MWLADDVPDSDAMKVQRFKGLEVFAYLERFIKTFKPAQQALCQVGAFIWYSQVSFGDLTLNIRGTDSCSVPTLQRLQSSLC